MFKFPPKSREKLSQIGVFSLLDLALLMPKSFDDTTLCLTPSSGQCTVEILVEGHASKGANLLVVSAKNLSWKCPVRVVIFNAKSWHYAVFRGGAKLLISANAEFKFGVWQFTNPRVLKSLGKFEIHFNQALKDAEICALKEEFLTSQNLQNEGLSEDEAARLLFLNQNSPQSVKVATNLAANSEFLALLKFVEAYNYALKLATKRKVFAAPKTQLRNIQNWLDNLPFKPTSDQLAAIAQIRADFASPNAARRVVMGDVGSGKTLVMLSAALSLTPQKSVLMVPTSVLAEQIFAEAKRLLPKEMKVALLTSPKGRKTQSDLSEFDLIIGTHALLWATLPPCALVMVDEQHKFGSAQRNKIAQLANPKQTTEKEASLEAEFESNSNLTNSQSQNETASGRPLAVAPHFLQFSATPIPRTLALMQNNFVSFSFLKEIPFEKKIHTKVIQSKDFPALLEHLKREFEASRQAIVVYPLVEESKSQNAAHYQSLLQVADFWQQQFDGVFLTHGKDKQKGDVLQKFRDEGNLLLATTLVEVGISLPRLSTIVIVGAERLGLASLHQLRGRVGRNGGEGWAFLFTKLKTIPQRLKEFAATLDGFEIARLDLANRKGGDVLDGSVQHGEQFSWFDLANDEEVARQASLRVASFKPLS